MKPRISVNCLHHSIYIRTVNPLPPVACFAELVYGLCRQTLSNMHCILDFCPEQPGWNQMYQSYTSHSEYDAMLTEINGKKNVTLIYLFFIKVPKSLVKSSWTIPLKDTKTKKKISNKLFFIC